MLTGAEPSWARTWAAGRRQRWFLESGGDRARATRVRFAQLDPVRRRLTLSLDVDPHGLTENVGEAVGDLGSSVADGLAPSKESIEDSGAAEGG